MGSFSKNVMKKRYPDYCLFSARWSSAAIEIGQELLSFKMSIIAVLSPWSTVSSSHSLLRRASRCANCVNGRREKGMKGGGGREEEGQLQERSAIAKVKL